MSLKRKVLYCSKCRRDTLHNLASLESPYEGTGLGRAFAAIFTLGASETTWADKKYECSRCGEIRSD